MPHSSRQTSSNLLVLHSLRCIGFAGLARIADAAGLPESDVESELIDLARAGHVSHTPGDFGGWGLTESGRAADAVRIAGELDTVGARTTVAQAYDAFTPLNTELLDLCTAWQLRIVDGVARPNEHTDPVYDSRVLDLFTDFGHRADVVCAELSAALTRFERYRVRLTEALTRARSGELDYLVDRFDSYHTVWFQLHEDLLVTLGIPRDWAAADR